MAATVIEIADAVVDVLNEATFSIPFVAERKYVPTFADPSDEGADQLAIIKVTVVPNGFVMTPSSRGSDQFNYSIDIGVFRRLESLANENSDPLMELVQEIADVFRENDPKPDLAGARCVGVENLPPPGFDAELMRQQNVFGSVVRLTLRKDRDK